MSLNRYEQAVFDYWGKQPDELRHWQAKIIASALGTSAPGDSARSLERELWDYFVERSPHVPALCQLQASGPPRMSMLNLAEHIIRLWGPPPKPKKSGERNG